MAPRPGPNGRCSICNHPERSRIERFIAAGGSKLKTAEHFSVSPDAVWRHWLRHVSDTVKAAHRAKVLKPGMELERIVETEGAGLLENLAIVRGGLFRMFETACEVNDRSGAASLAGRLHENLSIVAKATGQLQAAGTTSITNVILSPAYVELRTALVAALVPFPEARAAVARVFGQADRDATAAMTRPAAPMIEGVAA